MKPVGSGQNTTSNQAVGQTAVAEPKAAEKDASSNGTSESKNNGSDSHALKGEFAFTGQMKAAAMAEHFHNTQMNPNTPVDITNKEARNDLLRNTPQINPISTANGNGPHLCGGASMANALILSSNSPEKAKANAQAVRKGVDALIGQDKANGSKKPFQMSAEENAALKRMETGKMSPNDAMQLQQLMYKLGKRAPIGGLSNPSGEGLSTSQIASTMAMLKANGAFKESSVTMHCQRQPSGYDHWTTSVDGTHVNSQVGSKNKSAVMGGPPVEANPNNQAWQNEIWLNPWSEPSTISVKFRGEKDKEPQHQIAELQTSKYDSPGKLQDFESDLFRLHRPAQ